MSDARRLVSRVRVRTGALALLLLTLSAAFAQTTAEEAAATLALVADGSELVRDGAVLYDHNCSACHGDTGAGMAEARTSFPDDKRTCTRCHKVSNPPQMDHLAMNWRNAFDIGVAPAVVGQDARLAMFANGAGLLGYVRATMPRPWPGSLSDEEYLAIVAFLAAASGADVPDDLTIDELGTVALP